MISKTLFAKGFVALSTTSAVGTGALKFFSTKDLSSRVNEELKKRFAGKTNEEVLLSAGFKINKDESSIAKVLKKRSGNKEISDGLSARLASFCKEGLGLLFGGIDEAYKTLATVCTEEVSIANKVRRIGMHLTNDEGFVEKLEELNQSNEGRKFISDITVRDVANLKEACERVGAKDIFSSEIDQTVLSDYMTFCVEEKPSVIKFWTGSGEVIDIEKILKEKYLADIKEEAAKNRKIYEKKVEGWLELYLEKLNKRFVGQQSKFTTFLEEWKGKLEKSTFDKWFSDHDDFMIKMLKNPVDASKAVKYWEKTMAGGTILDLRRQAFVVRKMGDGANWGYCQHFMAEGVTSWKEDEFKQIVVGCSFRGDSFTLKMKYLKEDVLTESDAEVLKDRWSQIYSNEFLKRQSAGKFRETHEMFTNMKEYNEEEAKRLIGQCGTYSRAFGDFFEFTDRHSDLEKTWEAYTLVCAKNHEGLQSKDFWTHAPKSKA